MLSPQHWQNSGGENSLGTGETYEDKYCWDSGRSPKMLCPKCWRTLDHELEFTMNLVVEETASSRSCVNNIGHERKIYSALQRELRAGQPFATGTDCEHQRNSLDTS